MTPPVQLYDKKVCILGDTHFGMRNDNKIIAEFQLKFFKEIFFPYLERNGIKTVIQLGDLVDRRKYINYHTLQNMREHFFKPMKEMGITFIGFPGNHDIAQKESTKVNSLDQLFSINGIHQEGVYWYNDPTVIQIGHGRSALLIPWICEDNQAEVFDAIHKFSGDLVFGHLELAGFEMQKGQEVPDGMNPSVFDKFKLVVSGHYHSPQQKSNILYAGVPYEMSWADWNEQKGFWILDTGSLDIKMIDNPFRLHHKIFYNEARADFKKWLKWNHEETTGKLTKIIVQYRTNIKQFNKFVQKIEGLHPLHLQVLELPVDLSSTVPNPAIEDPNVDMLVMIEDVVKQNMIANEDQVITMIRSLYNEAQGME